MNALIHSWEQLAADVVAGVFLWSGIAKLRRPLPAAMAAVDFGVVRRVNPGIGLALGALEVCLAIWILSEAAAGLVLALASALLLLFAALILKALLQGKSFACACFGDAADDISSVTFLRTVVLLAASTAGALLLPNEPGAGRVTLEDFALWSVAAALVGSAALLSQLPGLLTWNRDPYSIGRVT